MKKSIMIICILSLVIIFIPTTVLADSVPVTGEWEVDLTIDDAGIDETGGTARLILDVSNTSDTKEIYFVFVDFAPGRASQDSFTQMTVVPVGGSQRITFIVDIKPSDVGVPLQIQVGMSQGDSNDVDGWGVIDGVKFESPLYRCSLNIVCHNPEIEQDEQTVISMGLVNMSNENARISVFDQDGNLVYSYDNVPPGVALQESIQQRFSETTTLQYTAYIYTMEGVGTLVHEQVSNELTITVNPRAINCDFNAYLSTLTTSINAGDDVSFSIQLENIGDNIHQFEISDLEAADISNLEGILSGESATALITLTIHESCDVSFVVTAVIDDIRVSKQTNVVRINVEEATPVLTVTPNSTPDTTATTTIVSTTEKQTINESYDDSVSKDDTTSSFEKSESGMLIVLVILIILLILLSIILIFLLKNKTKKDNM